MASPSDSSSLPPAMEEGGSISWEELPADLTSLILHRVGAIEMLETAQRVCRWWRDVCKDPSMWREIDMRDLRDFVYSYDYDSWNMWKMSQMCRYAVGRSRGGLVQIDIWYFATDELLNYIADSSNNLRSLRLAMCSRITNNGFAEAVGKLPLLEDLEVSYCELSGVTLRVVGQSCPNLKTLMLNRAAYKYLQFECDNDEALAIAETMPGLRYLQLFGNRVSEYGLCAILDKCPDLEHLDLRQCYLVYFDEDLKNKCSQLIKVVRRPYDSTHDYPYDATVYSVDYESDVSERTNYDLYDNPDYDHYGSDNSDYDQYDFFVQ